MHLQEVWEAQAAVVERSSKQAATGSPDEQTLEGEGSSQQHSVYQAQIERLTAADVVLVPYGVLSQEVGSGYTLHHTTIFACTMLLSQNLGKHAVDVSFTLVVLFVTLSW